MLASLFLILGTASLSMALRSFRHPLLHKLGALCILLTSFMIGWRLLGSILAGLLCASSWFMLPWLELLTRVRRMRLPSEKTLRNRTAPSHDRFPFLHDLTEEVEGSGFEQVADSGWDWEEYQQFFRLFYQPKDRTVAAICFVEQAGMAFYYLSITSRAPDGRIWMTWNYPFSNSLRLVPMLKVNRVGAACSFGELLGQHHAFLGKQGIGPEHLDPMQPEAILDFIQKDLQAQLQYNLRKGILAEAGEGRIRYSWRGLIFLWFQTIRDLVRLS